MGGSHAVVLSAFLFVLFLSGCFVCGENCSDKYINLSSFVCNASGSEKLYFSREIFFFKNWISQFYSLRICGNYLDYMDIMHGRKELLLSQYWNVKITPSSVPVHLGNLKACNASLNVKIKRHKSPCTYYSNSVATLHLVLNVGDLVFKLNPGPDNNYIASIVSQLNERYSRPRQQLTRNNLINVYCNDKSNANCNKKQLVLCNFNARSVRNKTAEIFDYICESEADLLTITEHWLTSRDAAIRAELCPNGYKMFDHRRLDRRGGGTGLIYRESLNVENIDAGASVQDSYEFSPFRSGQLSHHHIICG